MFLAYELKRPLAEILEMTPEEFATWLAFFRIKVENEKKAAARARGRFPRGGRR